MYDLHHDMQIPCTRYLAINRRKSLSIPNTVVGTLEWAMLSSLEMLLGWWSSMEKRIGTCIRGDTSFTFIFMVVTGT